MSSATLQVTQCRVHDELQTSSSVESSTGTLLQITLLVHENIKVLAVKFKKKPSKVLQLMAGFGTKEVISIPKTIKL